MFGSVGTTNNGSSSHGNGKDTTPNSNPSPVPPPRSPYRQNQGSNPMPSASSSPVSNESMNGGGATIIEPSLPATYGKLSPLPSPRRDPPHNQSQHQHQHQHQHQNTYMHTSSSTTTSRSTPPPVNTASKEGDKTPSFQDLLSFSFSPTEMDKDKDKNQLFSKYQDALANGSSHKQQSVSVKETTTLPPPPARKAVTIDTFPVPPASVDQHQRDESPSPAPTFGYDAMDGSYRTGQVSSDEYTQAQPSPRQPYPGPYQNRTQTRDEAQHSHPTFQSSNHNNHPQPLQYPPPSNTHQPQQQQQQQYQQSPSTPHFEQSISRYDSTPSPRSATPPSQTSQDVIPQGVASGPMAGIQIAVLSSKNFVNEKINQDIVCFTLSVRKTPDANPQGPPEELWRIQKLYSDIVALDTKVREERTQTEESQRGTLLTCVPGNSRLCLFNSHSLNLRAAL